MAYFTLFASCFLSASIFPFASEGVFIGMLLLDYDPLTCLFVATFGNSLGGLTNYWIGKLSSPQKIQHRFKNPERLKRWSEWVNQYGFWLAFFSWVPIVGDPLVILLGFFRTSFWPLLLILIAGKFIRYALIAFLTLC